MNREEWRARGLKGQPCDDRAVTVRASGVDIEADEGLAYVSVYTQTDGVDVRVGDLHLVVKGQQVLLGRQKRPYPIHEYLVLFDGTVDGPKT